MKKFILILWILLLVYTLSSKLFQHSQVLPIDKTIPCVYQVFWDVNQQLWVVSYVWDWTWVSAWHVIDPNYTEDLGIGMNPGQIIWLWKNIQNIGNDIWLFELQSITESWLNEFNEHICDTTFNGLVTYISWNIQKIPVQLSGTFIDYNPDYGQSGSPIFSGWKIIWIISRKYNGGAVVSLLP